MQTFNKLNHKIIGHRTLVLLLVHFMTEIKDKFNCENYIETKENYNFLNKNSHLMFLYLYLMLNHL